MTDDELEELFVAAKKRVTVYCDEYHTHSALRGCLGGDDDAVIICKLIETITHERAVMRRAAEKLGKRP